VLKQDILGSICRKSRFRAPYAHNCPTLTLNESYFGIRYMADLLMFIDDSNENHANSLWDKFSSQCYHPNMDLEEETHSGTFNYLDCELTIHTDNLVYSKVKNLNDPSVSSTGSQTFYRLPSFNSCTSNVVKFSSMITMFNRCNVFASSIYHLVSSVTSSVKEFLSIGYPMAWCRKAMSHMHHKTNKNVWKDMRRRLIG